MTPLDALLVEDDDHFRDSLATLVKREGFEIREAATLDAARRAMASRAPDVALVDLTLPDGDGLTLLRDDELGAATDFVVITGNATVETAIAALREGAVDYLTKPIDRARLKSILTNVSRTRELRRQVAGLRDELRDLGRFGKMVGRSSAMQTVYDLIEKVAPKSTGVLVVGESGSGKELVAETIHALSARRSKPFLPINCGAMSSTVIESELFGHERGSFTGADKARRGYFEAADGGTLFLDEISEMPLELQVKLLRVLETGSLMRVGASEPVSVDVRVVAATNRDPQKAVQDGKMREDLYYRLNVFPIVLPPLRDREDDVELLANHFLDHINAGEKTEKRWSAEALRRLRKYRWPGNVRELKNLTERAAILAERSIGPEHLPGVQADPPNDDDDVIQVAIGAPLTDVERQLILATLNKVDGDKKRAAEILGISVKTIYNRLNVYEAAGTLETDDP